MRKNFMNLLYLKINCLIQYKTAEINIRFYRMTIKSENSARQRDEPYKISLTINI